jgi:DNA-binding NarL/FixJ family response regulator
VLKVIFIGKINQTNKMVSEILRSAMGASIDFISPEINFADIQPITQGDKVITIYDLNTSHGCGNAPENIKDIKSGSPNIPILVLDHHDDKKFIQALIDAGASGIIPHTPTQLTLIKAVNELLIGNTVYDCPES